MVELGGKNIQNNRPSLLHDPRFLPLRAGSLIVAAILKATPVEWLEKIKIELNEEGVEEGTDLITRVPRKDQWQSQEKRDRETPRLPVILSFNKLA